MNIATSEPPENPKRSAFDTLRAQLQAAALPFPPFQELSEIAHSLSSAAQATRLFESNSFRAIQELNSQMSMSDGLRAAISQASSAAQAFREMSLNELSKPTNFDLGFLPTKMAEFDTFSETIRQYQQFLDDLTNKQAYLASLQRHAFGGETIEAIIKKSGWANSGLAAAEAARKSLDDHWGRFLDANMTEFDGGNLEAKEVERVVETISQTSADRQSLEDAVQQIIAAIQKQQTPEMQIVLWIYFRKIMDWLVSGIVGAIMGYYAPVILGESPQIAQKIVEKTARTAVGTSGLLSEYRYVSTAVLVIRQNPKAQSPQIARLSFGKAVKLIKKERDFALIHWADDESGVEIQGWVFARYLSKFN